MTRAVRLCLLAMPLALSGCTIGLPASSGGFDINSGESRVIAFDLITALKDDLPQGQPLLIMPHSPTMTDAVEAELRALGHAVQIGGFFPNSEALPVTYTFDHLEGDLIWAGIRLGDELEVSRLYTRSDAGLAPSSPATFRNGNDQPL